MLDAIVIGAGLSGLQAALYLQKAGLKVLVLEARDRVGGKVWSVPLASGRGVSDLGAAWVNDLTQPHISAYVKRFGIKLVTQRISGTAVMQIDDKQRIGFPFGITPGFSAEEKRELEFVRDHIQAESLEKEHPRVENDAISLDQYVRNLGASGKTVKMINLWANVMHGVESTEESAAFFIDYCRRNGGLFSIRADTEIGGNCQRTQDGTQAIACGMRELLGAENVQLSAPVASIEDSRSHVEVTTTNGSRYQARKCIVSIPSATYKDLSISPALPPSVREITDAGRLGDYTKVIVCYDQPWWRDRGFNGFFMSYTGPVGLARDTSIEEKRHYSLTCFVNGQKGRDWNKLPPDQRQALVIKHIAAVCEAGEGSEAFHPIEVFEQIWMHEEFSKGALAPITALGHLTKHADVYGRPVGNLHFTGTEYSARWQGYMEGALVSGEQVAQEVSTALQGGPRARL